MKVSHSDKPTEDNQATALQRFFGLLLQNVLVLRHIYCVVQSQSAYQAHFQQKHAAVLVKKTQMYANCLASNSNWTPLETSR